MNSNRLILLFLPWFLFAASNGHSQANDPWSSSAVVDWTANTNGSQFRYWDYFPSIAGNNHNGAMAQPSVTAGVTVTGIASCDASVGGRDIWFVLPPNPYNAATVNVRITLYNYDNTDAIPMRANVYTATSCTGSGACTLNRVATHCSNVLNQGGCAFSGSVQFTDAVSVSAGTSIYVQVWADDNDGDASASVYAFTNGSYSSPSNDACSGGINIGLGAGAPYAGSNFTANGGDFPTLASQATTCGWNVTDNSVFYYFTPTGTSTTFSITDVSCSFTGCDGNAAADLQFAIYRAPSPLSGCTSSGTMSPLYRSPCNNGTGTVTTTVGGLTAGVLHIMALDGLTGRKCTWSGITMSNIVLASSVEYFRVAKAGLEARIQWQAPAHMPVQTFELERSEDGLNFEQIASAPSGLAQALNSDLLAYELVDAAPLPGVNYYRLRMQDADGAVSYSRIEAVEFAPSGGFALSSVIPNPVQDRIQFTCTSEELSPYEVHILNATGQECFSAVLAPQGTAFTLDLPALAPGFYLLEVIQSASGALQTRRFLKE